MPFVILSAPQANVVRGRTKPGHALAPVLLADRTFALPISVIDDVEHQRYRDYLLALPQSGNLSELFDPDTLGPVARQFYDTNVAPYLYYESSWIAGQNVLVDLGPL